ncbi:MAG: 23S rRNA (pseudouridine(1915)-N(3))-methyltransferase RlmH [Clostridiales bacterium]|nr:23S rRNA (pseudouridine(1915)-N(3))-methyltransferase RlmH [Candidatus Coliplasma caballi]
MTAITLIHVGDFREGYFREAEEEYRKRLSAYCNYKTVCIPEERVSDEASEAVIRKALAAEAVKIRAAIPPHHAKVALCVEGKPMSSEQFAAFLGEKTLTGGICFLIGSSHGLDETLKKECDLRLSVSQMTFPHRIARILLAEQIYRGFTILAGKRYHK